MVDQRTVRYDQPRSSPTIVVVDDEPALLDLLARFLRTQGYSVMVSSSGTHALASCRNFAEPIHLVLLDFNLRDMNGLQLVHALNEFRPGLRYAFMTGSLSALDSFSAEGYAWIFKPFSLDALSVFVKAQISESKT